MHPQLTDLVGQYRTSLDRLHDLRRTIPTQSWGRRPTPDRWSPAECVAHLNLTSAAFAPLLHEGLVRASGQGGAVPSHYRRDFWGWLVAKLSGPSRRFRTKTMPTFVPTADRPIDELIGEFERLQADHVACLREADSTPLHRVKIRSPFEARIQYSLFSAFAMIPGHQQRHLAQAEEAAAGH